MCVRGVRFVPLPRKLPAGRCRRGLAPASRRSHASMTRSRRRASPTYPPRPTPPRPLRARASVLTARARSALLSVRGEDLSISDRGVLLEVVKDALLAGRAEILRGEPRGVRRLDEHRHDVSTDRVALELYLFACSKDDSHDHPARRDDEEEGRGADLFDDACVPGARRRLQWRPASPPRPPAGAALRPRRASTRTASAIAGRRERRPGRRLSEVKPSTN